MPNDWSFADIYHHVLKQSPSPEAAKIAISEARTNGRLPLYCERFERKVKNAPPPEGEKVFPPDEVLRDHQITDKQFSTWDWGRSYATRNSIAQVNPILNIRTFAPPAPLCFRFGLKGRRM